MARILYSYEAGFRAPRGGPIIDVQNALARQGMFPLSIDGVFATQSRDALKLWQARMGMNTTGAIDDLSWLGLTRTDHPNLFRRCLSLTAAFEGQGYTLAIGNFDGAGVTWGIVGFTLLTGDLAKVLKLIFARSPSVMADCFGNKLDQLLTILDANKSEKTKWANDITLDRKRGTLRHDWEDCFALLGQNPIARQVQDEVAHDDYWHIATRDLMQYGRMTERDAALFFDTAVQSGGVDATKAAAITAELEALGHGEDDLARLGAIARGVTAGVKPAYAADVASRRNSIASGYGTVHGAVYSLTGWALDVLPIGTDDLL